MRKRLWVLMAVGLFGGFALLVFLALQPAPPVVWRGTCAQMQRNRSSPITRAVGWLTAEVDWLFRGPRGRTPITISSRFFIGPPADLRRLTSAAPALTNGDGSCVWLLSGQELARLQGATATQREAKTLEVRFGPRVTVADGMQACVMSAEQATNATGRAVSAGEQLNVLPSLQGPAVKLTTWATQTEFLCAPGTTNVIGLRTNADFALTALVPRGGAVLVRSPKVAADDPRDFLCLLTAEIDRSTSLRLQRVIRRN